MKTWTWIHLHWRIQLFGILLIIFISCKKDEEIVTVQKNEIKINNKTYTLDAGFISSGSAITDVNNQNGTFYSVTLIGNGLIRNTDMAGLWFSGSGCLLKIYFYSTGSAFPSDGTYSTSDYSNNFVVLSTARFVFFEDFSQAGGVQYPGQTGTITLKNSGNKTAIEWDMQTMENMNFTFVASSGSFQGVLTRYE